MGGLAPDDSGEDPSPPGRVQQFYSCKAPVFEPVDPFRGFVVDGEFFLMLAECRGGVAGLPGQGVDVGVEVMVVPAVVSRIAEMTTSGRSPWMSCVVCGTGTSFEPGMLWMRAACAAGNAFSKASWSAAVPG